MRRKKPAAKSMRSEPEIRGPADLQERALHFAHRNGQRPETAEAIAGLLRTEVERQRRGSAAHCGLAAVLEERAGPELLSRVKGWEARRGQLRLEVTEPAERYELRLRWEQRLLTMLQAQGITAVRFVAGR